MDWFVLFLVAGAGIAVWRIVHQVRRASQVREDDWDSKLIERLRRSGADPFRPVEVDFFVAVPSRDKADQVAERLRAEGFSTDVRELADSADQPWSVHAMRSMQQQLDLQMQLHLRHAQPLGARRCFLADSGCWHWGADKACQSRT